MDSELMEFLYEIKANIPVEDPLFNPILAEKIYLNSVQQLLLKLEEERKLVLSKDYIPNALGGIVKF